MVSAAPVTPITPSRVFPLPNAFYKGTAVTAASIGPHGGVAGNIGGSDIPADKGSTIVSIASGTLISAAYDQFGGNVVLMKGNDGNTYYYAHMLAPYTGPKTIQAGQLLGQVDNTGNAANTIPHLHIGICSGGPCNTFSDTCICNGTGASGGIGNGTVNAVAMLKSLAADPRTNNQDIANSANGAPGSAPINPPDIASTFTLPNGLANMGFTDANLKNIELNAQAAVAAGIDPALWLAIVAHESRFQDGIMNTGGSGACGFAQLLPCTDANGNGGVQYGLPNIQEGLRRLKQYLDLCSNQLGSGATQAQIETCALDTHYGGAGAAGYFASLGPIITAINNANPNLVDLVNKLAANFPTLGSPPPSSGGGGSGGFGSGTTPDCTAPGSWTDVAGIFNYAGCVIHQAIENWITSLKDWWGKWQTAHVPQVMFIVVGLIVAIAGLVLIGMDNSDKVSPVAKAVKGATQPSKEAPAKEAPAAADVGEHLPSAAADAVTDVVAM